MKYENKPNNLLDQCDNEKCYKYGPDDQINLLVENIDSEDTETIIVDDGATGAIHV